MKETVMNWVMGGAFALLYIGFLVLVVRAVIQYVTML